jgi:hypothetical protein
MVAYFVGKHILSKHHSCLRSNIHVSSGVTHKTVLNFWYKLGRKGRLNPNPSYHDQTVKNKTQEVKIIGGETQQKKKDKEKKLKSRMEKRTANKIGSNKTHNTI